MTASQQWASNICSAICDELTNRFDPEVSQAYIRMAALQLQRAQSARLAGNVWSTLWMKLYADGLDNI